jgi:hypothetical protein
MHAKIYEAIGPLLNKLQELGARFDADTYSRESFGDFHVDCTLRGKRFRLFRDRNQYMIDGDMDELKRLGLWRAYDSVEDYCAAVVQYAKSVA